MLKSKKKVSIDFTANNYNLLTITAKEEDSSNSTVINNLVETMLPLPKSIKNKLGNFCVENFIKCIESLQVNSTFDSMEVAHEASQWKALSSYFGIEPEKDPVPANMRKVLLKDGYCIFPKDWLPLGNIFGNPEDCTSVYVIESRNSTKYGIPHFVVFSPLDYQKTFIPIIPEDMEAKIYEDCARIFPDFKKFYNMQIKLTMEEEKDPKKLKEWDEAPHFGIFNMIEKDDPTFYNPLYGTFEPPGGSMIVRNASPTSDNE